MTTDVERPGVKLTTDLGTISVTFGGIGNPREGYLAVAVVEGPGLKWRGYTATGRIILHAPEGRWRVPYNYPNELHLAGTDRRPGEATTKAMHDVVISAVREYAASHGHLIALGRAYQLQRQIDRVQGKIDDLTKERDGLVTEQADARQGILRPLPKEWP